MQRLLQFFLNQFAIVGSDSGMVQCLYTIWCFGLSFWRQIPISGRIFRPIVFARGPSTVHPPDSKARISLPSGSMYTSL